VKELRTRQIWKCYDCKKQFSVKVGTIFEDSPLPLNKWLIAIWMLTNCRNGISSCEIERTIGVTQKTAWFMMHRIREAMAAGTIEKLSGTVEADETFVGGKDVNRHANKKRRMNPYSDPDKAVVMGMVERGGKVVAKVVDNTKAHSLKKEIRKHVTPGSILFTDNFASYDGLHSEYYRSVVNHANGEYVRGDVHTNNIENYWSLVKRMIKGTYIHVSPEHLDRYLDEQALRYNVRIGDEGNRFEATVKGIFDRRLTWNELTGKDVAA